jgi:hypothetical protein
MSIAASTSPEPTFTCFPQLPVEIQNMIWGHCFKTSRVLTPQNCDELDYENQSYRPTFDEEPGEFRCLPHFETEGRLMFVYKRNHGYTARPPPAALYACKAAREEGQRHGYFAFGDKGQSSRGTWFNPDYDTVLLGQFTLRYNSVDKLRQYFKGVKHLIIHFPIQYGPRGEPINVLEPTERIIEAPIYAVQDRRDERWRAELRESCGPDESLPDHTSVNTSSLGFRENPFRNIWDIMPLCRSVCIAVSIGNSECEDWGHQFCRVDDEHMVISRRWKDLKGEIKPDWQRHVDRGDAAPRNLPTWRCTM